MTRIQKYWDSFKKTEGLAADLDYYEAFSFGIGEKDADELLELVLAGKKRATTSPYLKNEKYCKPGDYSIVLDSKGEPRCIIRTVSTRIMAFREMTFDVCRLEGQDECLDTWIEKHVAFLRESGKELGYEFSYDMPIIFEEFTVVCR